MLKHSPRAKAGFLAKLHKAGLLGWRRRTVSRVGVFFVKKKNGMQRMVLDARAVNALHKRPPRSKLAVPGALSKLLLSDEALAFAELGDSATDAEVDQRIREVEASGGVEYTGSGIDLTDGFYQFKCERLAEWFGLGLVLDAPGIQKLTGM